MKETSVQITNAERLQNVTISPLTKQVLTLLGESRDFGEKMDKLFERMYIDNLKDEAGIQSDFYGAMIQIEKCFDKMISQSVHNSLTSEIPQL